MICLHKNILAALALIALAPSVLRAEGDAEYKAFKEAIEEYLKRQAAAVNQDLTATRELTERQQTDINAMLKAIRAMQAKVNAAESKVIAVSRENEKLKTEVARLSDALAQEKQARKQADRDVVAKVTGAIEKNESQAASRNTQANRSDGQRYKVARGDTLGAIAKAFGTSVAAIRNANDLEGDLIRPGQELIIPKEEP